MNLCDDLKSQEAGIKYLPDTLKVLLQELFTGKQAGIKVASIGQAMMQATRPRYLYHHYSWDWVYSCTITSLVDSLYHHDFCCSYYEVQ